MSLDHPLDGPYFTEVMIRVLEPVYVEDRIDHVLPGGTKVYKMVPDTNIIDHVMEHCLVIQYTLFNGDQYSKFPMETFISENLVNEYIDEFIERQNEPGLEIVIVDERDANNPLGLGYDWSSARIKRQRYKMRGKGGKTADFVKDGADEVLHTGTVIDRNDRVRRMGIKRDVDIQRGIGYESGMYINGVKVERTRTEIEQGKNDIFIRNLVRSGMTLSEAMRKLMKDEEE